MGQTKPLLAKRNDRSRDMQGFMDEKQNSVPLGHRYGHLMQNSVPLSCRYGQLKQNSVPLSCRYGHLKRNSGRQQLRYYLQGPKVKANKPSHYIGRFLCQLQRARAKLERSSNTSLLLAQLRRHY